MTCPCLLHSIQVHDVDGRLAAMTQLLHTHGFHTTVERQETSADNSADGGFLMFTPASLRLCYVYATRPPAPDGGARD